MNKTDKTAITIFIIIDIISTFGSIVSNILFYNIISLIVTCFCINHYQLSNSKKNLFKIIGGLTILSLRIKILLLTEIKGNLLFCLLITMSIISYYLIIELPYKITHKNNE